MTSSSWNPPTGPPNGAAIRPADARREIDDALQAAQTRDRELRAEVAAVVTARVMASDRLAVATEQAAEARSLSERALRRSNESARAGQRADAAKWTAVAQVFAMRLRDARDQVTAFELQLATAAERARRVESALAQNVGRLRAVAAARLPMLTGRKASRAQHAVDEVVAVISTPIGELVTRAREEARTALAGEAATEDDTAVAPVADEDLERQVDVESTDAILDELRTELGLPAPTGSGPSGPSGPGDPASPADTGETADPDSGAPGEPGSPAQSAPAGQGRVPSPPSGRRGPMSASASADTPAGKAVPTRSWPVPAARR